MKFPCNVISSFRYTSGTGPGIGSGSFCWIGSALPGVLARPRRGICETGPARAMRFSREK